MGRWDITGKKIMNENSALSEMVVLITMNDSSVLCECADPGTGGDECFCEDF